MSLSETTAASVRRAAFEQALRQLLREQLRRDYADFKEKTRSLRVSTGYVSRRGTYAEAPVVATVPAVNAIPEGSEKRRIVGSNVKRARKAIGMSQEELATRLGIRRERLSQYETGHRGLSTARLNEIAQILGIDNPLAYFFVDHEADGDPVAA